MSGFDRFSAPAKQDFPCVPACVPGPCVPLQKTLVSVVTPLGNRPKTAVPVLTPPVNRCLVNRPKNARFRGYRRGYHCLGYRPTSIPAPKENPALGRAVCGCATYAVSSASIQPPAGGAPWTIAQFCAVANPCAAGVADKRVTRSIPKDGSATDLSTTRTASV